jgi:phosphoglycolate phosphatase
MTTKSSSIKAVIFDLDGTIVHLPINWSKLKQELIQTKLLSVNQSLTDAINETKAAPNQLKFKQLMTALGDYETSAVDRLDINQAVYNWIHANYNRYLLSICSSNLHSTIEAVLKKLSICQHFPLIIGNEDVNKLKPDPEGINKIITRLRLTTTQTAFVGDQSTDHQTATRAGIKYYSADQLTQLLP